MKNVIKTLGTILILSLMLALAFAEPVKDLYHATIVVPNQSKASYNKAAQLALAQVLVKVTGNTAVASVDAIKPQLAQAPHWITSFSYEQQPRLSLSLTFDSATVNRLLKQAKQPIWGRDRPQVIVWLAQQTADGREIINSTAASSLVKDIDAVAANRGVDLVLPMLDLDDLSQVNVQTVWAQLVPALATASHRYGTDGLLIGRVYPKETDGQWAVDWRYVLGNEQQSWHGTAASADEAVTVGVNQMVDMVAQQYRIAANARNKQHVQVSVYGVDNVADYSKVREYLQTLSFVNTLKIASIGTGYVTFDIDLKGDRRQFMNTLAVDHTLQPDSHAPTSGNHLNYRFAA